jgi:hypothetical protein
MTDQTNLFESATDDSGESLTLATFAERAYLDYAISVVKGRALPDVCDGQKPVQRRILYAMDGLGVQPNRKPVKCGSNTADTAPVQRRWADARTGWRCCQAPIEHVRLSKCQMSARRH